MLPRLYNLLTTFSYPFWFLHTYRKSIKEPVYRENVEQRIGFYPFFDRCIWIHCVSLGESIAAKPLIQALQAHFTDTPLLITNTTATGRATAQKLLRKQDTACFLPYDIKGPMRRMLKRTNPLALIIMETELWPNLIAETNAAGIPIILNNARLSARSAAGYQKISTLTQRMLSQITHISAQNESDQQNFIKIGANPKKLTVTGSIKFDLNISTQAIEKGNTWRKEWGEAPIWIAASTHAGEEEIILAAHAKIRAQRPTARLLLVPRHPNRFDAVTTLCKKSGFITQRVTDHIYNSETAVIVGDTMGDLLSFYQATDLAFVGGSLANIGGHNFIEPAALKKALLSGPILHNFSALSEKLVQENALSIIKDADELSQAVVELLKNESKRMERGLNGYEIAQSNKGACQRQLSIILTACSTAKTHTI